MFSLLDILPADFSLVPVRFALMVRTSKLVVLVISPCGIPVMWVTMRVTTLEIVMEPLTISMRYSSSTFFFSCSVMSSILMFCKSLMKFIPSSFSRRSSSCCYFSWFLAISCCYFSWLSRILSCCSSKRVSWLFSLSCSCSNWAWFSWFFSISSWWSSTADSNSSTRSCVSLISLFCSSFFFSWSAKFSSNLLLRSTNLDTKALNTSFCSFWWFSNWLLTLLCTYFYFSRS